jgi:hypothetical protein
MAKSMLAITMSPATASVPLWVLNIFSAIVFPMMISPPYLPAAVDRSARQVPKNRAAADALRFVSGNTKSALWIKTHILGVAIITPLSSAGKARGTKWYVQSAMSALERR